MEHPKDNSLKKDNVEFCSSVLAVENSLENLNLKISKSFIRNFFKRFETYPELTLENLSTFFDSIGIDNASYKINKDFLLSEDMLFPAIGNLSYDDKGLNSEFCVINEIKGNNIKYYSPNRGFINEDLNLFLIRWNEIIMFLEVNDNTQISPQLNDHSFDEEIKAENYRNSIEIIDGFLDTDKCNYIIDYCERNELFNESKVITSDILGNSISKIRTSHSAFIRDREDNVFMEIYKFVSNMLNVPEILIEDLQCVRYSKNQEFRVHFDTLLEDNINSRHHTLLLYLNDGFSGGDTFFPELKLKIKPQRGRLIHFTSRNNLGERIFFSSHAGLPVEEGIKYACNIWVNGNI